MKKRIWITAVTLFVSFLFCSVVTASETIILNHPKEEHITTLDYAIVSGETIANASVVVLANGEKKEFIKVGPSGLFITRVSLKPGKNVITVKVVFPSGKTETVSRNVYRLDGEINLRSISSIIQALKLLILR
ncbi:MAG: hypothetical protein L5655_08475 [Thermosediminibacteraceae bacterium]|nr:hypothetical protein [Thermosediminibacteraceae bacterium]